MCSNGCFDRSMEWGRVEFVSTLRSSAERIRYLMNERKNLLLEMEKLKSMAASKEKALEGEVSSLREEVRALRELLGAEEPATNKAQEQKSPTVKLRWGLK